MAGSVPVRCPECRREHTYTPPVYPCDCGAPVTLPLLPGGRPAQVRHRTWAGSWVEVRCPACGISKEWPQPELGCGCGTLLRMPVVPPQPGPSGGEQPPAGRPGTDGPEDGHVHGTPAREQQERQGQDEQEDRPGREDPEAGHAADAEDAPAPAGSPPAPAAPLTSPGTRPAFRPVTIRTAQDARTAAAEYLRWLGFPEVRVTEKRPASGVDVRGAGIIAHVDPTTAPTTLREVETLWLNGLNEEVATACFSLAGYSREARTRADSLSVPLFVLDLTGMPQAVNDPADDLIRSVC